MLLIRTDCNHPDFEKLIMQLDADLWQRYPNEQAEYSKYNKVTGINTVVLAYENNEAIACGCFKPFDETTVEIKRMFVHPNYRGKKISVALLNELERWARELGYSHVVLETGNKQHEAIGLYTKQQYTVIPNYGQYIDLPNSICFRKRL